MQHIAMAQADQPPTSTEFTVLTERSVSAYARQFLRHAGLLAEVTAHEDLAISAIVRLMSSHDELVSPERDVLLGAEALGLVPTPLLTPVEDLHGGGAERDDVGRDTGVCADPSLATRARYAHIVEGLRAATEGLPE
jgi:ribosomal protein L2